VCDERALVSAKPTRQVVRWSHDDIRISVDGMDGAGDDRDGTRSRTASHNMQ
jgi:hypothetical protein